MGTAKGPILAQKPCGGAGCINAGSAESKIGGCWGLGEAAAQPMFRVEIAKEP
jgi:hypothetical protein